MLEELIFKKPQYELLKINTVEPSGEFVFSIEIIDTVKKEHLIIYMHATQNYTWHENETEILIVRPIIFSLV